MTFTVLDMKKICHSLMQELINDSYKVLLDYNEEELIPKAVAELLLEIGDFNYFSSLIEEKEVGEDFYNSRKIYEITSAMKKGFFDGSLGSVSVSLCETP